MRRLRDELAMMTERRTLERLWRSLRDDDLASIAAEVTFYTLFGLFPFLLFVAALVGMLIPDPEVAMGRLLVLLHRLLPATTAGLLAAFLEGPLRSHRPYLLSLGIIGVLWAGSQGFAAVLRALSRIYCARETRSWARQRALSLAMMIGVGLVSLLVLVLMTGLDPGGVLSGIAVLPPPLLALWSTLRWPVLFLVMSVVLARFYTTVPCVRQRSRWITPGGLVASLIWLAACAALPVYVGTSESYSRLYGSIGDVIVLMLWLYVGAFALLLGAEINTAILRAGAHRAARPVAPPEPTPARSA